MELWYTMHHYLGVMDHVHRASGVRDLVGGGTVSEGRGYQRVEEVGEADGGFAEGGAEPVVEGAGLGRDEVEGEACGGKGGGEERGGAGGDKAVYF